MLQKPSEASRALLNCIRALWRPQKVFREPTDTLQGFACPGMALEGGQRLQQWRGGWRQRHGECGWCHPHWAHRCGIWGLCPPLTSRTATDQSRVPGPSAAVPAAHHMAAARLSLTTELSCVRVPVVRIWRRQVLAKCSSHICFDSSRLFGDDNLEKRNSASSSPLSAQHRDTVPSYAFYDLIFPLLGVYITVTM